MDGLSWIREKAWRRFLSHGGAVFRKSIFRVDLKSIFGCVEFFTFEEYVSLATTL